MANRNGMFAYKQIISAHTILRLEYFIELCRLKKAEGYMNSYNLRLKLFFTETFKSNGVDFIIKEYKKAARNENQKISEDATSIDGRRPISAGGINEPRRLGGSGTNEGRFSRMTSIFGASPGAGGCTLGTLDHVEVS
ncbi:hypothetical protein GQX74_015035 [Glossina fuscipes]|nr:hypothetical protein GQX74_015035 [Glossina fuscipes]